MTTLYMLDTDVAIYVIKGRPEIERRLSAIPTSQVCISAITRAELFHGLQRLPAGHRLHGVVGRFLEIVQTVPWGKARGSVDDPAAWYAAIRHQLVSTGQPIGEMDMMISAHAIAIQATLVTNNVRHYTRINAPLTIVNWV